MNPSIRIRHTGRVVRGAALAVLAALAIPAAADEAMLAQPRRVAGPRPADGFPILVSGLLRSEHCADVVVCAHRGNGAGAPENSLSAIRKAAETGALMIEIDVRDTRDGVLVLLHDPLVDRTLAGGSGFVSAMTVEQFRGLRVRGLDEAPPTLAEALEAARGRAILQLDLKTDRMDLVARAIADAAAFDRVTCGKGSLKALRELKRLDRRIEVIPRASSVRDLEEMLDPALAPVAVQVEESMLAPDLVRRLRGAGARVWVNSLGMRDLFADADGRRYAPLLDRGADIIQTDRPAILVPRARAVSERRYAW